MDETPLLVEDRFAVDEPVGIEEWIHGVDTLSPHRQVGGHHAESEDAYADKRDGRHSASPS